MASTDAQPQKQIPKHLQDLQIFIAKTISDAGRGIFKCSDHDLSLMHADDFYIHAYLYGYFKRKAIDQKRMESIAIGHGIVMALLHKVLLPSLVGTNAKRFTTLDATTCDKTDFFPLLPQRALREQLACQKVVLDAFAEVIEVCSHLDTLQGHKKAAFGMVNMLHFIAIAITLVPVDGVLELLSLVLDDADLPLAIKYKLIYVWSLIDVANNAVLRSVCQRLLRQATSSGYTYVDVTELPPMTMNGPAATTSRAAQSNGAASTASQPAFAAPASDPADVCDTDDKQAVPVRQGPRVVYHGADEEQGDVEDSVTTQTNTAQGGDDDFWLKLAS